MTPDAGPPPGPARSDRAGDTAGTARLVLPEAPRRRMVDTLEAAYPREGCGLLLGRLQEEDRLVEGVRAADNRWEGRNDRYLVDPETLRRAVQEENRGGPRVLGFFHSHPDAAPSPSSTDRELAWPWYLYLIVPVREGRALDGRAWQLQESGGGWTERAVVAADATVADA